MKVRVKSIRGRILTLLIAEQFKYDLLLKQVKENNPI